MVKMMLNTNISFKPSTRIRGIDGLNQRSFLSSSRLEYLTQMLVPSNPFIPLILVLLLSVLAKVT